MEYMICRSSGMGIFVRLVITLSMTTMTIGQVTGQGIGVGTARGLSQVGFNMYPNMQVQQQQTDRRQPNNNGVAYTVQHPTNPNPTDGLAKAFWNQPNQEFSFRQTEGHSTTTQTSHRQLHNQQRHGHSGRPSHHQQNRSQETFNHRQSQQLASEDINVNIAEAFDTSKPITFY